MFKVVKLLVVIAFIAGAWFYASNWIKNNPGIINRGSEAIKSSVGAGKNLVDLQSKISLLDDDLSNIKLALGKGDLSGISVLLKKYLADFSEFKTAYQLSKSSLSESETKILSAKEAINFEEFTALKNKIGSNKDLESSFQEVKNSINDYIFGKTVKP